MSEIEIISKKLFEYSGSGKLFYVNGSEFVVNFSLRMLQNGKINGELRFHFQENKYPRLLECLRNNVAFSLKGKTREDTEIEIGEGTPGRYFEKIKSEPQIECKFKAQKVSISPSLKQGKPGNDLCFQFGLVNLDKIYHFAVETELGQLTISNYEGIEVMNRLMQEYGLSFVTTAAELTINIDGRRTIEGYLTEAKEIVQNFLKITSLAHGCWHDWAFVIVGQKENASDKYRVICTDLHNPQNNSPNGFRLTNTAHSPTFLCKAWSGYSNTHKENYGLDYALEWYVETSTSILEIKYLNAMTALELLMTYYYRHNETKFIRESDFNQFYQNAKRHFYQMLDSSNIDKDTAGQLKNHFSNMNRPNSPTKARKLVEHWGILTSDLEIPPEEKRDVIEKIFDIRNEITHSGRYHRRGKDTHPLETLTKAYSALFSLLTRILLAMLKYTDSYRDMSRNGEFIELSKVCTSVRAIVEQNKLSDP
jgi:hypothetical protein